MLYLDSSAGVEECYTTKNIVGDGAGNCGYSQYGTFVGCSGENSLCGQLQCASGTFQDQVDIGVYTWSGSVTVGWTPHTCLSFSPDFPPFGLVLHAGLVSDGTKCGDQKVSLYSTRMLYDMSCTGLQLCINAECTSISSIASILPCPVGPNGETCSGNGVNYYELYF